MDPQHSGERIGESAAILARFGLVGLVQRDQHLPMHNHLHLRKKLLPLDLLVGGGELLIRAD